MRALKALVIIMGVLIVIATAVVIYAIVRKVGGAPHPAAAPVAAPVAANVTLPDGCSVAEMVAAGDRLALRLAGEGDCRQILLVDPTSGAVTGHIALGKAN